MSPHRLILLALALTGALAVPAGAADPFGSPSDLGLAAMNVAEPQVAIGAGGSAVAAWIDDAGNLRVVERSGRAAAWSAPRNLGPASSGTGSVRVALAGNGNAAVVWRNGANLLAANRRDGAWASPETLSTAASSFDVAFDGTDRGHVLFVETASGDDALKSLIRAPGAGSFLAVPAETRDGRAGSDSPGTPIVIADVDVATDADSIAVSYIRNAKLTVARRVASAAWEAPSSYDTGLAPVDSTAVALTSAHRPVLAWETGGAIRFGSVGATGLAVDVSGGSGSFPQLAADASGNAVALWREGSMLRSRARAAGADERWSIPYDVASGVSGTQPYSLAMAGNGEASAAWVSSGLLVVRVASAAWDQTLTQGHSVDGMRPAVAANATGDRVLGFSANDSMGATHAFLQASAPAASAPPSSTSSSGGSAPSQGGSAPSQGGQPQPQPASQDQPVSVKQIFGVSFTMLPLAQRRDKMPGVKGLFSNRGVELIRKTVPFADVDLRLDKGGCPNGAAPSTIVKQVPAAGTIVDSAADAPAKVTLSLCVPAADFVRACDEKAIEQTLKKIDDYALGETIIRALARCKVDWDVRFVSSKNAAGPEIGKVDVKDTPAKRDPMDSVLECPTDPALQNLRVVWSIGARQSNAAGFHAADPKLGWTLPGPTGRTNRITSYVHMSVIDRAKQFVRARAYVDTDGVGAPQMKPLDLDARGERSFTITPDRPGLIRVCVVYEPASGPPQFQTAAIRVVDPPKEGGTWPMVNGRVLKVSHGQMVPTAGGAAVAHAAGLFDFVGDWLGQLFTNTSRTLAQLASNTPPGRQAATAAASGYELGQIAWGGTLGGVPQLPRLGPGWVIAVDKDGRTGWTNGAQVIYGSGSGTTVGVGPNGVVSAGGGNVVSPGGANVVSPGGANVVSSGGGNVVSSGGGNVVSSGGGNVVSSGGANALPADLAKLISENGLGLANPGTSSLFAPGAQVVSAGGGNVVPPGVLS